jgi:hypothetical protein
VLAPVIVGAAEARLMKHDQAAARGKKKLLIHIFSLRLNQCGREVVIMFFASALAVVSFTLARYSIELRNGDSQDTDDCDYDHQLDQVKPSSKGFMDAFLCG